MFLIMVENKLNFPDETNTIMVIYNLTTDDPPTSTNRQNQIFNERNRHFGKSGR